MASSAASRVSRLEAARAGAAAWAAAQSSATLPVVVAMPRKPRRLPASDENEEVTMDRLTGGSPEGGVGLVGALAGKR